MYIECLLDIFTPVALHCPRSDSDTSSSLSLPDCVFLPYQTVIRREETMKLAIPLILILANEISYGVCHMAPWAFVSYFLVFRDLRQVVMLAYPFQQSTFAFNGPDQACLSDIYQVPGLTGNQTGCQGGGVTMLPFAFLGTVPKAYHIDRLVPRSRIQ